MRWPMRVGSVSQEVRPNVHLKGAVSALLRPGMHMLDAACGTGAVVRRLRAGVNGQVDLVLLDTSQRMLDKCRDIPAERVLGCMKSLPFDNGQFDFAHLCMGDRDLGGSSARIG